MVDLCSAATSNLHQGFASCSVFPALPSLFFSLRPCSSTIQGCTTPLILRRNRIPVKFRHTDATQIRFLTDLLNFQGVSRQGLEQFRRTEQGLQKPIATEEGAATSFTLWELLCTHSGKDPDVE